MTNDQIVTIIDIGQQHPESLKKLLAVFPANTVYDGVAVFVDGSHRRYTLLWEHNNYVIVRAGNGRTTLIAGIVI